MHPPERVAEVLGLVAAGWNDLQISRATGINRTTIREWRTLGPPGHRSRRPKPKRRGDCPVCDGRPMDRAAYAYLLGLYLGDGWISPLPRTTALRIVQDARYPHLISLAVFAIRRVRGRDTPVGTVRKVGCVEICAWWKHWPCLFPQHGPGKKHERRIELVGWQKEVVAAYPRQLLRGLVHSDGCRTTNRILGGRYAYPRYLFTNRSEDILRIFGDACAAAGHRIPEVQAEHGFRGEAGGRCAARPFRRPQVLMRIGAVAGRLHLAPG